MDTITFGKNIKISFVGGSHDIKMSVTISNFPSGVAFKESDFKAFLDRRRPLSKYSGTERREEDNPVCLSGIKDGLTTGDDIIFEVENRDVDSAGYEKYAVTPRPSHADYVSVMKYGKVFNGSGMFSGRMTLLMAIAGYFAKTYLAAQNIDIRSFVKSIGSVERKGYDVEKPLDFGYLSDDISDEMIDEIQRAKESGDSVGGIVECVVTGLPVGLGGMLNYGLESSISANLFSIPAIKGVEFGAGFNVTKKRGSVANDELKYEDGVVRTISNNNGGINGGISNGMPLVVSVAIKPTPSISLVERTINLETKTNDIIKISGRHDACIAVRVGVAVESMMALTILDEMMGSSLKNLRNNIDDIDDEIVKLLVLRQQVARDIGDIKRKNNIELTNLKREQEIINRLSEKGIQKADIERLYAIVFEMSKREQ